MEKMMYEKPKMRTVELRNSKAVADPCYPGNSSGEQYFWFNTAGKGYVKFQVGQGCKDATTSAINITYYIDGVDVSNSLSEQEKNAMDTSLLAEIKKYNEINNFKGIENVFPGNSDSSWS